jgi:4-amino-4-deoxy-L-arabinose transferase-like glycosyltransferase
MRTNTYPRWLIMLPLILIGFGLRIYHIDNQSFWTDEMATWEAAHFWPNPIVIEAPMYTHAGLAAISLIGIPGEIGLRWPSVIAGMFSIALLYGIGKQLHSSLGGLIAALLLCISPTAIYYSQEARSYAAVIFGSLFILWMTLLAERRVRWASYLGLISAALTVALHLVSLLWIITLIMFMGYRKWKTGRGASERYLMSMGVLSILIVFVVRTMEQWGEYGWIKSVRLTGAIDAINQFYSSALGFPANGVWQRYLSALLMLGIVWLGWRILSRISPTRGAWSNGWALLLSITLVVGPPVALIAISYIVRPIWVSRYVLPSMASLILLAGLLLASISHRLITLAGTVVLVVIAVSQLSTPYNSRPAWREMMPYLANKAGTNSTIMVCPYWDVGLARHYSPQGSVNILPYSASNDGNQQIQSLLNEHETIYFIDSGCPAESMPEAFGWGEYRRTQIDQFNHLRLTLYRQQK